MASEGDILRAERLYIEAGESVANIAATIGVTPRSVQRWASSGDWEVRRVAFCRRMSQSVAADEAVAKVVGAKILTRARGLEILADIAESERAPFQVRINAVKAHAEIDAWASASVSEAADGVHVYPGEPSGG